MPELLCAADVEMLPGVVVAPEDYDDAAALGLEVALLVWEGDDALRGAHGSKPLQTMTARVVGALALSAEGQQTLQEFVTHWSRTTGMPDLPLAVIPESDPSARRALASQALLRCIAPVVLALAKHNADLLGMLAQLRLTHERQGILLRKYEEQLRTQSQNQRWLTRSRGPLATAAETGFCLMPGATLRQRLELGSEGVSDVAIFVPEQMIAQDGQLKARLHLSESGDVAAEWTLPAAVLHTGWLRLSLARTLSDDIQTLQLEFCWQGRLPLRLGAGLYHPDPGLCARLNGQPQSQILAYQVWTFLAESSPPLPADGHCEDLSAAKAPGERPSCFYLDPTYFEQALEADPDASCVSFHQEKQALQVHPRPDELSAARLLRAVPSGVRSVSARVGGLAPICPIMEYALAVVPRHPVRPFKDLVAEAEHTGCLSDWVRREGDVSGDLTLHLREPLPQACDLLLITRVPPGHPTSHGWATFRDIRMSA
ncbi:DUF6212 domain-containing protein [Pararhodobacter sp. CCB-MM2]|uniref:DUF6212 domain-containing protein n=1 Tax=Pararhodobacter sp. CCB-MM2 TaxID=1786003 RepID=UPI0008359739|nr:DUF6212 domain-containing protein [Pararhodobacter sp. CCB-MM2]